MLDITTIQTVEELDSITLSNFADDLSHHWHLLNVRYPVRDQELNRICELSNQSTKYRLCTSWGELYYKDLGT